MSPIVDHNYMELLDAIQRWFASYFQSQKRKPSAFELSEFENITYRIINPGYFCFECKWRNERAADRLRKKNAAALALRERMEKKVAQKEKI